MKMLKKSFWEGGAKDPWSENDEIERLIRKYRAHGLRIEESSEKQRFFVIETDTGKVDYFHNRNEIPIESMDMERLIRKQLGLSEDETESNEEEGGSEKEAA